MNLLHQRHPVTPLVNSELNITSVPVWIELNNAALQHNALQLRRIIPADVSLAFVVKSNAYGHGLREISLMVQHIPEINWLCVFSGKEALEIRSFGCTKPILILGPLEIDATYLINQNIACMVDNKDIVDALACVAQKYNTQIPVHIKIDTGLSRFGVLPHKTQDFVNYVLSCKNIMLQGIYTHFAESDNPDLTFTYYQASEFEHIIQKLRAAHITIPYIHATNSAGLFSLDINNYNFFRVGIALYGVFPASHCREQIQNKYQDFNLHTIVSVKARLSSIKQIPAGQFISYKRTYQVIRPTTIGIINLGYSDGYSIQLSNKGMVRIGDLYAPVLGRVAMNVIIVDITDIPQVTIGTPVILLDDKDQLHPDHIAINAGIDNVRALFTGLGSHLPRFIV